MRQLHVDCQGGPADVSRRKEAAAQAGRLPATRPVCDLGHEAQPTPTMTSQAPSILCSPAATQPHRDGQCHLASPFPPVLSPCASLPWILGFGTPQPHAHKHLHPSSSPSTTALTNPFNYFLSERRSCMLLENNQINGFYFKP